MRRLVQYVACGLGVAVATILMAAALEVITASALPQAPITTVDRTLKGDRLPPAARPVKLQTPASSQRLPDGCESVVSTITRSPLARQPGRCVS
jgi:hypothetical protein